MPDLSITSANLANVVQNIAAHFDSVAKERNIQFELNTPETCKKQIDVAKIELAILNLISNAFKSTPDLGRIQCSLNPNGNSVWILVGHRFLSGV
ncbi:hypothetical protein A0128_09575 [Leptospira tipperaryensis]|uniref:Histidine kinase/HSP90-like ATPase domain-containing protein n=1 Tax=Leptospira tipperaryensis TaxID=2564040 RepID=A0A1D7UWT5_9LEPT|nr:sensor histidine kinase [Leptospira tipperaryensis]AOP34070.1 hypothetical protein A0128_09575 [Leptospira tipperaryensis]